MARAKTGLLTRGLEKLRGVFVHAPSQPDPGAAAKKAAKSAGAAKQSSASGAQAEGADASKAQDDKTPHKKIPAQPWYRHRQRW